MLQWTHSPGASLALDDTHFPVLIATWIGAANPAVAEAFGAFLEAQTARALAQGVRPIIVHDALHASKPAPHMIDHFSALGRRTGAQSRAARLLHIVVLDSVFIRTVLSAVTFFADARGRTRVVKSRAKAIDLALQAVDEEGLPRPDLHPDAYEPPNITAAAV